MGQTAHHQRQPATFAAPGLGVLDLYTPDSVAFGAEDEGEVGAYHDDFNLARVVAVAEKLTEYLPLGQELSIRYDKKLNRKPPRE